MKNLIPEKELRKAILNNSYCAYSINLNEVFSIDLSSINGLGKTEDGVKVWFKNGKFHRDLGPAIEYNDGYKEWWVDGVLVKEPYNNQS